MYASGVLRSVVTDRQTNKQSTVTLAAHAHRGLTKDMEERMAAITESANVLGFPHLKDKQIEALDCFLAGKDTFVSLPTG